MSTKISFVQMVHGVHSAFLKYLVEHGQSNIPKIQDWIFGARDTFYKSEISQEEYMVSCLKGFMALRAAIYQEGKFYSPLNQDLFSREREFLVAYVQTKPKVAQKEAYRYIAVQFGYALTPFTLGKANYEALKGKVSSNSLGVYFESFRMANKVFECLYKNVPEANQAISSFLYEDAMGIWMKWGLSKGLGKYDFVLFLNSDEPFDVFETFSNKTLAIAKQYQMKHEDIKNVNFE